MIRSLKKLWVFLFNRRLFNLLYNHRASDEDECDGPTWKAIRYMLPISEVRRKYDADIL